MRYCTRRTKWVIFQLAMLLGLGIPDTCGHRSSDLRWSKASTSLTLVASRRNFSITSCGQHHGKVSSTQDSYPPGRSFWDPMDCHSYLSLLEGTGCYGSVPWYSDCGRFWPIPFSPIGNDWWTPKVPRCRKNSKWVSVKNRHGNGPNRKIVN